MKFKQLVILSLCVVFIPGGAFAQSTLPKPRLVVNIVVGGMRYDYIEKFGKDTHLDGINTFLREGVVFTGGRYDFMQTNSASALATLTTGADPAVHGVIGPYWQDYTTGRRIGLIDDPSVEGLDCEPGGCRYSNINLTAPTLGDRLRSENAQSKVVSIAADPVSAVVMGGMDSDVFWFDTETGNWTTSSKYMLYLPGWAVKYNEKNSPTRNACRNYCWNPSRNRYDYVNKRFSVIEVEENGIRRLSPVSAKGRGKAAHQPFGYEQIMTIPLCNEMVAEFAKQAVINEGLGSDDDTDIINICFDAPRYAAMLYGPESMEVEDMYYRMDRTIASLMEFISERCGKDKVLYVLTADHGTSPSFDAGNGERDRFNSDQFKMILNGFLCAQYGGDDWVVDYYDRRVYLNRNQIFQKGLSLAEVQGRMSDFALQFRGLSHAMTSSALQGSGFSDNFLRKIQNGFYPKRSGDMVINLMPGWIEESEDIRSTAGSLYDYDTHVPFMVTGCGIRPERVGKEVNMNSLAPTLARIIGINKPDASTSEPIEALLDSYKW